MKGREGRYLFRYEANWVLEEDCDEVLKRVWVKSMEERGSSNSLQTSLEESKNVLLRWNR